MESKIQVIQENSDLDEEEARLALDLAEGDIEEALQMIDYVDKPFFTLQIKFETEGSNKVYGLINLVGNGKEGETLKLNVVTTYKRDLWNINVNANNKVFNQTIREVKEDSGTTYDLDVRNAFTDKLNSAQIFELFTNIKEECYPEVEGIIRDLLNPIFNKRVELEIGVSLLTKTQLNRKTTIGMSNDKKEKEEEEEKAETDETQLSIYLKSAPVISAVNGCKVKDLEVGDDILVRIVDKREVGRYLGDLISTERKGIAIGNITDIYFNEESGRYTIMLEFGPKIYGKLLAEGEIKIALVEELEEKIGNQGGSEDESNIKIELDIPWVLITLFVVLIIIVVFLLQFN
ncbi:hypothetical protein [Sporohalobacter salinus]|uniref:hypothetical protein n=1 Tax=Sporohalobacter salinus TaxID=1494606 RepID=UPI00195FB464|nr:hypothetical protein [Sporohalobacter salinus]MBM7624495.1 sporulation protein YlmC with PRC-barrel domain [Sporohalobacter salinus]